MTYLVNFKEESISLIIKHLSNILASELNHV